jgi:hypothetical protein
MPSPSATVVVTSKDSECIGSLRHSTPISSGGPEPLGPQDMQQAAGGGEHRPEPDRRAEHLAPKT